MVAMRKLVGSLAAALALTAPVPAQETPQQILQGHAEHLRLGGAVTIDDATIAASSLIPELYERRGFEPLWTSEERIVELVRLVGRASEEGLDPEDYHHAALQRVLAGPGVPDARTRAELDVLLTDSLARYGFHFFFGKVNPAELDQNWNWSRELDGRDPAEVIQAAVGSDSIEHYLQAALQRGVLYRRMKSALAEYRGIAAEGGWPIVPDGPTLKTGMEDDRVPSLRRRLAASGDLDASAPLGSRLVDDGLEAAIRRFQERHNLDADGAVGPQTLAAMNVPVEARIDQIRLNLERLRWVAREIEDDFVVVNIAAFRTFLVRGRELAWSARSQVGRSYRQTPVFKATLKYLVFNPTWTVPPGILSKDILPAVRKDPGYLATKEIDLLDANGKVVDPQTVDWSRYTGRNVPYRFVQRPGPSNALGRVKFIFPNEHFVFLHDTPSKGLFDRTERTFSSGCIRVERPFELAQILLDDPETWNETTFRALLDSEKPRTVFLREPLTVMLLYATVMVDAEGTVSFFKDVYQRDARILEALDGDFVFHALDDAPDWMRSR
jgi:murein L,D-transpeptidase YcbB/YkuD